ncbi:drebrin-like protein [Megalops cyprinoides]|uniref:drebrin-like protein n=1 Tax=Megalops cyprinoides TaxID=118141 RepID=UPI001864C427|nr:drebrin-like protein [Megalops cyprinoides]
MKAINLDTYNLSLLTAKEDILNPRSSTNWALFTYDGATNNLKLSDSGVGGLSELAGKFHASRPLYGLCRLTTQGPGQRRIVMINWVGEEVAEHRRKECASHIPAIKAFFKEAHVFISASTPEDVTEEKIISIVSKVSTPPERTRRPPRVADKEDTVGTNYRKTNAAMEMRRINRESFWARAEREEEERKEEERRRATEDRRRWERERVQQERREAEERDRKMNEKLQLIEEQRRMQAKMEAEVRKQERAKWEQQQREHEEDMRARFRRSESIEKAAEAAALVSQRSTNPREFFRQLSSSSTLSPTSPGSPRTVKPPFRRYQRSLTDTAFIFNKPDIPSSPRSPTMVSPFSRTPTSPFYRSTSPTSPGYPSPTFRPISSPQRPRAPLVSPPTSPQRFAPSSPLPSLPPAKPLPALSPQLRSQPDSPPRAAGPPEPLPRSPAATSGSPGSRATPPREAPTAPLPQNPVAEPSESNDVYVATRMLSDLEPEADMTVQAVLVDTSIAPLAEEEEEEEEAGVQETKGEEVSVDVTQTATVSMLAASPSSQRPTEVNEKKNEPEEGEVTPDVSVEEPVAAVCVMAEITPEEREPEPELAKALLVESGNGDADDQEETGKPGSEPQACAPSVQPTLVELAEEEEEPEAVSQPLQEPIRTEATDAVCVQQPTTQEAAAQPTNGIRAEEEDLVPVEQNGTERSLSPSETELSPCAVKQAEVEEDFIIKESTENGEETTPDGQLCVRALYDYQAEDDSELSLEPGDIISAVETVDKAWWRGCSKDGRQGLFPANYVETI